MVAHHPETFCAPLTVVNGTDGVTENIGLSLLLAQTIPRLDNATLMEITVLKGTISPSPNPKY